MTDLGAHVYGARGNAVPANVFGRIENHLFRALLLNHLQTRRKPTGHWWVECGKEVVGKTVNSERARTDPVRTYVDLPGNGRQAPAKRAHCESRASIAPVAVKSFTTLSRGSMFLF